ncbi:hypothetical protein CISG_05561 [Coccidioides immitis RMSCC 3703]|uniref:SUN domain-containing protein n=1 Tax=Coccidioides immitis RMSCC 3703 TaxID=454286 RepID=A0A0J8TR53_COCIT|nr:hypothetical protein CISG_05561 [Coccidioides immitis RMSCC 3703]
MEIFKDARHQPQPGGDVWSMDHGYAASCPVRDFVDVQAEYVRYPVCLGSRRASSSAPDGMTESASVATERTSEAPTASSAETPDKWKELGTYEAANTREIQAFAVENPLIWARYLKIEFFSHYGNEFYCPLSLVRVHGTTMMEEYKNYGDSARAEEEAVEAVVQAQQNPGSVPTMKNSNQTQSEIRDQNVNISITQTGSGTLPDEEALGASCFPQINEIERLLLGMSSDNMSSIYDMALDPDYQSEAHESAESETWASNATGSTSLEDTSVSDTPPTMVGGSDHQRATPGSRMVSTSGSSRSENETTADNQRTPVVSQPPPPNPATQESFFKSVHKRLQMLETNSTLSLLYIEEQSRILRDAFNKVEKRQLAKTSSFLENLNSTVLHELREFRQQYDHIWHSVVIEFEQQRQQYHHELFAVTSQLAILADEVVFQKRVSIIQSVFVLLSFGLVLFSRSAVGSYLEFPKMQSMVSRSHSFRSASPPYETPSPSPNSPMQSPPYQEGSLHRRNPSDGQTDSEGLSDITLRKKHFPADISRHIIGDALHEGVPPATALSFRGLVLVGLSWLNGLDK